MEDVEIFVLTHKKIDYDYNSIHKPLLCGSDNLENKYGYLEDNTGDNISNLNKYYAELTGQYWAWKNSNNKYIGFCHYRRFFADNILLNNEISEKRIMKLLKKHDIIVAQPYHVEKSVKDHFEYEYNNENKGFNPKELNKLREYIKIKYPGYLESFDYVLTSNKYFPNNMFITKREIANDYFNWVFNLLKSVKNDINFEEEYKNREKRVLGYFTEILLTVYILKNNLKVKKQFVIYPERKFSWVHILNKRFSIIRKSEGMLEKIINKLI